MAHPSSVLREQPELRFLELELLLPGSHPGGFARGAPGPWASLPGDARVRESLGDDFQGGISSPSKPSGQLRCGMDMRNLLPRDGAREWECGDADPPRQVLCPPRLGWGYFWQLSLCPHLRKASSLQLQELAMFLRKDVGGFLQLSSPQIT